MSGIDDEARHAFLRTNRFDALDGLRAISVLLVIADHTKDPLWAPLHGRRSYALYLFHPLVANFVGRIVAAGSHRPTIELSRFAMISIATSALADLTYRVVERPLIELGHRLAPRPGAA